MPPADVLIIYFAAGTPFGVYSLLALNGRFSPRSLVLVALKFIVWPFFAGVGIYHYVTGTNVDPNDGAPTSIERLLADIRSDIRNISANDSARDDIRQLMSAFDTYTVLAEMATCSYGNGPMLAPALLEAIKHPAPIIAARCLDRRNRVLLASHRDRAEVELRAAVLRIEKRSGGEAELTRLVDDAVGLFSVYPSTHDSELGVYSEDGILSTA